MLGHTPHSCSNHRSPPVLSSIRCYPVCGTSHTVRQVSRRGEQQASFKLPGWKQPRPPEKFRRPTKVGHETGKDGSARDTSRTGAGTRELHTPLTPSVPPPLPPSLPPASFILAVSRSIPRLRSERWCVQHSNESTALLQSSEKGPH